MKPIGRKVYQRKAPRVIRYQIRQQEISRNERVWSTPMWQVAPSPLEAVVAQYPGCSVVKDPMIRDRYSVTPLKGAASIRIPVECKPATV